MGIQTTQHALNVFLLDISPHSQAIIEFFIGSAGKESFKLVSAPAEAEVTIADFDYPVSKERWEKEHSISAKPCIALSMNNPENPAVEWVIKPLTAKALLEVAKIISKQIEDDAATNSKKESDVESLDEPLVETKTEQSGSLNFSSPPSLKKGAEKKSNQKAGQLPPPLPKLSRKSSPFRQQAKMNAPAIHTRAPVFQQADNASSVIKEDNAKIRAKAKQDKATLTKKKETQAEITETEQFGSGILEPTNTRKRTIVHPSQQRLGLLCGESENVASSTLKGNGDLNYNIENYFQGTLIAGLRLAKQTKQVVQIKYAPHQFYICYDEDLIFSAIAPDSDEYVELCSKKVKPGQVNLHILTSSESTELRKKILTDIDFTYDLESFIWTNCLLTSRGRVPSILEYELKYLLKYWPNFTRIENFPHTMKLAARWQKKPYTIVEIINETDIPLRYVIAFVNGALGLGLFETNPSIIEQKSAIKSVKKNGLIARLFGRLTKSETAS